MRRRRQRPLSTENPSRSPSHFPPQWLSGSLFPIPSNPFFGLRLVRSAHCWPVLLSRLVALILSRRFFFCTYFPGRYSAPRKHNKKLHTPLQSGQKGQGGWWTVADPIRAPPGAPSEYRRISITPHHHLPSIPPFFLILVSLSTGTNRPIQRSSAQLFSNL